MNITTFKRIAENKLLKELFGNIFLKDEKKFDEALQKYCNNFLKTSIGCEIRAKLLGIIFHYATNVFEANEYEFKRKLREGPYFQRALKSVVKGIYDFGIEKPFTPSAPFLAVWNFTRKCNLKCKHCYQNAGTEVEDVLNFEERIKVVDVLDEAGVTVISFSGGEPLVDADFFKIAKYAAEKGMAVTLATNGTLIDKKIAKKIKKIPIVYAEVSLDFLDQKKHDEFRGVKGSWQKTVNAIKSLAESGVTTCVAMYVNKYNYEEIEDMVDFSESLGAKYFAYFDHKPAGRADIEFDLEPWQRKYVNINLARKLVENAERKGIIPFSTSPQYGWIVREVAKMYGKNYASAGHYGFFTGVSSLLDFVGGCGAGRAYIAIQENGDITPCVYMPSLVVGNILKDSFKKIWKENEVFKTLRDREKLQGSHKICENKYICGGCRARAYGYFGDIAAPDPGCVKNQEYWNILQNKYSS